MAKKKATNPSLQKNSADEKTPMLARPLFGVVGITSLLVTAKTLPFLQTSLYGLGVEIAKMTLQGRLFSFRMPNNSVLIGAHAILALCTAMIGIDCINQAFKGSTIRLTHSSVKVNEQDQSLRSS